MLLFCHFLVGSVHLARLLPSLLSLLGSTGSLPLPPTPAPSPLEYLWLLSLPSTLLALAACRRSNSSQLRWFQYVIMLACIAPAFVTLSSLTSATTQFLLTGEVAEGESLVLGHPFAVLWSAFLLLCLLLHSLQLLVVRGCLKAWAPRHGKRQ